MRGVEVPSGGLRARFDYCLVSKSATAVRHVLADRVLGRESVGDHRVGLVGTLVEHDVGNTAGMNVA